MEGAGACVLLPWGDQRVQGDGACLPEVALDRLAEVSPFQDRDASVRETEKGKQLSRAAKVHTYVRTYTYVFTCTHTVHVKTEHVYR